MRKYGILVFHDSNADLNSTEIIEKYTASESISPHYALNQGHLNDYQINCSRRFLSNARQFSGGCMILAKDF